MKVYLVIMLLALSFTSCAQKKAEDTIRLIPEGYIGPVLVIFNQKNGEPKEYEGDKRVYRIPKNGVLRTQFEPNYGVQHHQYFYIDRNGSRSEIRFVAVQDKDSLANIVDKSKIYAYREQAIGEGLQVISEEDKQVLPPARSFYIGHLTNTENTAREQMNFTLKYHN